ncbi:MAG: hypothetical protein IKW74_02890 [Thermoguttaceae bacterium]|nr:hypothetical protein [Thermoguttaceae bacterium]
MKKFIALTLVAVCACCFSLGCKKPADTAAPATDNAAPAAAPADAAPADAAPADAAN